MASKQGLLSVGATTAVAALLGILLFPANARGKSRLPLSPTQLAARKRKAWAAAEERAASMKPARSRLAVGDFTGALREFRRLDARGGERFTRQEAMCLLHLGRAKEGLALISGTRGSDLGIDDRMQTQAVLAVSAHDRKALDQTYATRKGLDLKEAERALHSHPSVNPNPPPNPDRDEAHFLMSLAWDFGAHYDREAMHILADEAMRLGATDVDSLQQYAASCASNGDLGQALTLCKKASALAKSRKEKLEADSSLYRMKNLVFQLTRTQSLAEVEESRHKLYRASYFLITW
jgi:hypothetical protein